MNPFRYRFSLRLRHPTMDPKDISSALGMKPHFQWMAGKGRTTPKGDPLEGVNAVTYWCSEGIEGEGFDLAGSLSSHLLALEARRPFFADFVLTGGSIDYFVAWFTDGLNTGATLPWQLLKRLSDLRIDLDLDVYGTRSPSDARSVDAGAARGEPGAVDHGGEFGERGVADLQQPVADDTAHSDGIVHGNPAQSDSSGRVGPVFPLRNTSRKVLFSSPIWTN